MASKRTLLEHRERPATPVVVPMTQRNAAEAPVAEASGCHGGKEEMLKAAKAAGKSEVLDQYAKDYPQGPHDQPQSMCPAFGSLRVGLRMRRTERCPGGAPHRSLR